MLVCIDENERQKGDANSRIRKSPRKSTQSVSLYKSAIKCLLYATLLNQLVQNRKLLIIQGNNLNTNFIRHQLIRLNFSMIHVNNLQFRFPTCVSDIAEFLQIYVFYK